VLLKGEEEEGGGCCSSGDLRCWKRGKAAEEIEEQAYAAIDDRSLKWNGRVEEDTR
jgi:hypothetical protein